jgi:hypothetical protein
MFACYANVVYILFGCVNILPSLFNDEFYSSPVVRVSCHSVHLYAAIGHFGLD